MEKGDTKRVLMRLWGVVQGVGFRPFIFRTAQRLALRGWVENQGSRVLIDVEGSEEDIKALIHVLREEAPANTHIAKFEMAPQPLRGYPDFSIQTSISEVNTASFLPPDIAVCRDCMREFNTPGDRRYQYPFISCAHCGPRYSIITSLPYDRENTTMARFPMCPHCAAEYQNPADRRFHAQTNCCPDCGPALALLDAQGNSVTSSDPLEIARELVGKGEILAVKGVGGYHLCCNAADPEAVKKLRIWKRRPHKPLAVMARHLEAARTVCEVSRLEAEILEGGRKPILLLPKRESELLPEDIALRQRRLGVMLPYAPLHALLFPDGVDFLVMTSGNWGGDPICYREDTVAERLGVIASHVLTHNREITVPVDDAVVKVIDQYESLVRCGRGYAPLTLPIEAGPPLLAVGAEQKNTVCMGRDGFAAVSQHMGALDEYQTYEVFEEQIQHFRRLFSYNPSIIAHDWNPDDLPGRYAAAEAGPTVAVQHHHAHLAGCMAEHGLSGPVIGVIYDGTGLGTDGAVWGGEFLTGTLSGFTRAGHLAYVRLQGGDYAVREPWRCAASYLWALQEDPHTYLPHMRSEALDTVSSALRHQVGCCLSSSMGRLFDCVAALCGFHGSITYEAQAAIELESLADPEVRDVYHYQVDDTGDGIILGYEELLGDVLGDLRRQVPAHVVSARFHQAIVEATAECVGRIHEKTGLQDVVLSGGVFENVYLLEGLISRLRKRGLRVYCNRRTPTNDGGIAFGQAAVAGAMGKGKGYVSCYSSQSR